MSSLAALLRTMRPRQWTKNLILFAPLLFAGVHVDPSMLTKAFGAFAVFCLMSGFVYIANDLVDIEKDKVHAEKCLRPLASGELPPGVAKASMLLLFALVGAGAYLLGPLFAIVAFCYVALQSAYIFWTKHEVILDVMSISVGFVLRAAAGAVAIGVAGSPWLYTCAALLALFLAVGKRRHELLVLDEEAARHRPSLAQYSPQLIDSMLSSITAATIVTYALYTFFSVTGREHQFLMLTIPFVVYGLFRYLYLVYKKNLGGSPEEILLTDRPLIVNIVAWVLSVAVIVFAGG